MAQKITITINKGDSVDAQLAQLALQQLANNITLDNLETLAEKSHKPGINDRIKKFKSLI